MKRFFGLLIAVVATFMLVSCGTTSKVASDDSDIPEWYIMDPDSKDGIYGVGQAKMSDLDVSVKMAEADARNAIAKKVNIVIKDVVQNMVSGSKEDAVKGFEENALQTTEVTLQGCRRTNFKKAKDGTVYIQVFLPYDTQVSTLNKVATDYKLSDEYLATQDKMKESYDKYFANKSN